MKAMETIAPLIKKLYHKRDTYLNANNARALSRNKSTQENLEGVMYKDVEENKRINLEAAKAELDEARKELNSAKENAMQSWLDSKPLIDELEKKKANLANAQQYSSSNSNSNPSQTVIAELESQLEISHERIKSKREEHNETENMIYEINQALDQMRDEMERLKLSIKKGKQTRAKLKQRLHLRRRRIQTMQLTLQAVLLEADTVELSKAETFQQINHSENDAPGVKLNHKDYYALTRRAEERISQANWRVSVSMEQKHAAETTRELALSRLNHLYSSRSSSRNKRNIEGQCHKETDTKIQDANVQEEVTTNLNNGSPKSHAKSLVKSEGGKSQHSRRSASSNNNNIKTTKKSSIFYKMKKCLQKMIRKMNG